MNKETKIKKQKWESRKSRKGMDQIDGSIKTGPKRRVEIDGLK